ncbi:hypothetical protein ACFYUM_27905 [Streptomyces fimicarius]|uniref:hypothetical protein n=1 Tax=Streptomyces TaxID=1883 RepID=UPI0004AB4BAC|nr:MULTISPECIES: hypothetical protein [Streptomyces]QXQ99811.1 hypothetical protein KV381_28130 [Streptomyces sp. WY228]WKN17732.1 hypothetical protein NEH83_28260 [Streptomyces sp. JUS-F4]
MKRTRLCRGGALGVLLAAALLTGCQQDGGDGASGAAADGTVSVSALRAAVDEVGPDGADECPLPYDVAEAAKKAGLSGKTGAGPAPGDDSDDPAVTGESKWAVDGPGGFESHPGALISCRFHVGGESVEVHTVATESRTAENVLMPVIVNAGALSLDDGTSYLERTASAAPGEAVATENGGCVTVRVKPADDGDAALVVTAGEGDGDGPGREKLTALASALHAQLG